MIQDKVYFRNLDAIRYIAALMVFLHHAFDRLLGSLSIKGTYTGKILYAITDGGSGVSIFFVLSGFLITYLLITEHDLNGKISLKNFYVRRVLRIWPLYYAVVLFTFAIYPGLKTLMGINNPLGTNVWYHVSFLSNFDMINIGKNYVGNDAMSQDITWSVSIEEQFYAFWPLIFFFLPKKLWAWVMAALITVAILFRLAHLHEPEILYFHTLSGLIDLCIGGFMAWAVLRVKSIRTFFETCGTAGLALFLCTGFLALFFRDDLYALPYGQVIGRVVLAGSFALVIVSQAITTSASKLNLGNWKYAHKWGRYTYGIYLLHPIVILALDIVFRYLPLEPGPLRFSIIAVPAYFLTLGVSWLSYRYYESRFLKLKEKFTIVHSGN